MEIIDAHIHCGIQHTSPNQSFEVVSEMLENAGVTGAVCFPPVAEIYERSKTNNHNDEWWQLRRKSARDYAKSLKSSKFKIYPFYFVWNDFDTSDLDDFCGIKWHRHENEPQYLYDSPRCASMIDAIKEREFPILIEEEYKNMMHMISEIDGKVPIIIPHLGEFNGGFEKLLSEDLWKRPNIYSDISWEYLNTDYIKAFIKRYGPEKLIYGSDFPFGSSDYTKEIVEELGLSVHDQELIYSGNILRLLKNTDRS